MFIPIVHLCPGSVLFLERVFSIWTIADLIRIVFFFFWFKDHLFLYPFTPQFKNNTKIIVLLKSLHMLHFWMSEGGYACSLFVW